MAYCERAFDHEPETVCDHCKLAVDKYGNTEEDFLKCSFPDCGCDGSRLCMAGEANCDSLKCNVEGMYERKDSEALAARMELFSLCMKQDKKNT